MKIFDVNIVNNIFDVSRNKPKKITPPLLYIRNFDKDVVEIGNFRVQETEFGTIKRLPNGKFDELIFDKPVNLHKAFQLVRKAQDKYNICYGGKKVNDRLNRLEESEFIDKFKGKKFIKFVGASSKISAFELENGNVLKLSEKPHFALRDNVEDFDAPIWESGNYDGKYFYYIQKRCDKSNITLKDVENFEKRIKSYGYNVTDMGLGQIGRGEDGKLYLIDYECAIPATEDIEFLFD